MFSGCEASRRLRTSHPGCLLWKSNALCTQVSGCFLLVSSTCLLKLNDVSTLDGDIVHLFSAFSTSHIFIMHFNPLLLYAKMPSTTCWIVSLQRWIEGSMEDLHTSSSSDRQREAQTYSLQIREVGIVFHTGLTWKGIWCRGLIGIISLLFTAVAQQRQTSLQREPDSATKALINGSTLTDCELWWVEGKVELG